MDVGFDAPVLIPTQEDKLQEYESILAHGDTNNAMYRLQSSICAKKGANIGSKEF